MIKKPTLDITHPEIAAQIHPDSINKPNEVTARSNTKLLWQCPKGHVYERPASSITLGNGCKECRMNRGAPTVGVDDLATTHPDLAAQLSPNSAVQAHEVGAWSTRNASWTCDRGHVSRRKVDQVVKYGIKCPKCRRPATRG